MRTELLILQPTTFCNIDCAYCYLAERSTSRMMSIRTVRNAVAAVLNSTRRGASFTVVWHAGEPLVAPKTFYREALALIGEMAPAGVEIRNNIQTNGLLIDEEWAEIFSRWNVRIGLSIDGPAQIHDRYRVDRRRRGTHALAMKAVDELRRAGVPFHCIAVVTEAALADPVSFWEFFRSEGIFDLALNIEEAEGLHVRSSLDLQTELEPALRDFYEIGLRMYLSDRRFRVREFDGLLSLFFGPKDRMPPSTYRPQTSRPFGIVTVDVDGRFSTFSPELCGTEVKGRRFLFGNVNEGGLDACLDDPYFQSCASEIEAGVALCAASCDYYDLCRGGCPSNKFFENGSFVTAETRWCRRSKQTLIDTMLHVLEDEVHVREAGGGLA